MAKRRAVISDAPDLELPPLEETTGRALAPEAALKALADADPPAELEDDAAPPADGETTAAPAGGLDSAASRSPAAGDAAAPGASELAAPAKRVPPKKGDTPETRAAQRERKAKKLKRDVVVALYLESATRADELEKRIEAMQVEVAAVRQVGADVIDQSVTDMVTDGIEFLDAGAQALAGMKGEEFARAVALDERQKARAILLTSRVAKIEGAAYLEHSPKIALGFFALTTVLGKLLELKLTAKAVGESAVPANGAPVRIVG